MDGIKEAFEIVFGEEFINEMMTRLIIIACSLVAILLVILVIAIWKTIVCKKINKAIIAVSEYSDNEHAEICFKSVKGVSPIGRFFAKHSKSFSGLSKGECRTIYNQTILSSDKISSDNKKEVRASLLLVGCSGLTDI